MFPRIFPLVLVLPLTYAWFPGPGGPVVERQGSGETFTVDFQDGVNAQDDTSKKPNSALYYTTDGGTPVAHPYEYQRIGSDGLQ